LITEWSEDRGKAFYFEEDNVDSETDRIISEEEMLEMFGGECYLSL
jgi:hypothetical protein